MALNKHVIEVMSSKIRRTVYKSDVTILKSWRLIKNKAALNEDFLTNKNNSVKVIYFFTELGKSKGNFLDAMKNINIPRVPISAVTSIA